MTSGVNFDEVAETHSAVLKASVLGGDDSGVSNVLQGEDEDAKRFGTTGALEPPFNPRILVQLFEHSNSLRQNVDAYSTNIDGFGHRYEPAIDLDKPESDQRIAQAIYQERMHSRGEPGVDPSIVALPLHPTDEEVEQRKVKLVEEMRAERAQLDRFFDSCSVDCSFVSLRRQTRQDLETTGNAYWEVVRDGAGKVAEFVYVAAHSIRLLPLDLERIEVSQRVRISDLSYATKKRMRYFRRMVQVFEQRTMYFKEFGDPRTVSATSGKVYTSLDDLRKAEGGDKAIPATELIHFKLHSSRSAYGVPRWIGNLLAVIGSRQSEEVNYAYFENKSVPPLALIVSGGTIGDEAVKRIESFIASDIRGKKNFHKILLIEGEPAAGALDGAARMKISLQPLTSAQQQDALFQQYDQNNQDKVGMSFRLPRLLRGDIRDFNRATADAAVDLAERQVFAPERDEFDFLFNHRILPELGIRFWKFRSNASAIQDPDTLTRIITQLTNAGIIVPEEARQLAEGVFNREFPRLGADWTKQPIQLTVAGMYAEPDPLEPWTGESDGVGEDFAAFSDANADGVQDDKDRVALQVTPTMLGNAVTLNEIRASQRLGPKMLPDGRPDPDGDLTIAEYTARQRAARGEAPMPGATPRPKAKASTSFVNEVRRLISLRKILEDIEARDAARAFYTAKKASLASGEEEPRV